MGRSKIAPSWMKDALRRIKGMISKEKGPKLSKAERKALRSRSMPFIDPTADGAAELAYAEDPVPGMAGKESADSNELISRLKASKRQQSSPALPLTKSPRNRKKTIPRLRPGIRRENDLAGPAGVKSRNSAPVLSIPHERNKSPASAPPAELQRARSQPIIGAFVPKNVNQLKAVPFSLSEKMSRWCKRSPMALIKAHLAPDDPIDGEHPEIYEDVMCDAHGRNIDTLAINARDARDGVTAKPRDECVLEMYPPGRHGITNHFDSAPVPAVAPAEVAVASPVPALRQTPVPKSRAPPTYDVDTFQQQSPGGNSRPRFINLSASEKVGAETKSLTRAGGPKPLPPKRMPTNISIIPQRTMSNLNEGMLAQLTTVQ